MPRERHFETPEQRSARLRLELELAVSIAPEPGKDPYQIRDEEPDLLADALDQSFAVELNLSCGSSSNPQSPFIFDLRPLRFLENIHGKPTHHADFLSTSVYGFLTDTLFDNPLPNTDLHSSPESAPSTYDSSPADPQSTPADPHSSPDEDRTNVTDLSTARLQRTIAQTQRATPTWRSHHAYRLFAAPFILYRYDPTHEPAADESAPSADPVRTDLGDLRALPLLSPNLPERFLTHARPLMRDTRAAESDDQNPTLFPRVFIALWAAPAEAAPKRIAGWGVGQRVSGKPTRFSFDLETPGLRYLRRNPDPEARDEDDSTDAWTLQSVRRYLQRGEIANRSTSRSISGATLVAAADPSISPFDEDYAFDDGVKLMSVFHSMLFRPEPIGTPTDFGMAENELTRIQMPTGPELDGGLFAVLEMPTETLPHFSEFPLKKRARHLSARSIRRARNHKRRPSRTPDTHMIVPETGVVTIAPSLAHLTLITPRGCSQHDFYLRARRLSQPTADRFQVTIYPELPQPDLTDTDTQSEPIHRKPPLLSGDRLIVRAGIPAGARAAGCLPPGVYLLEDEDPPVLWLDPDEPDDPAKRQLTLTFRRRPTRHATEADTAVPDADERPAPPDGHYVLGERE